VEKLTFILATAENAADIRTVLDKSVAIARCFGARVEFLVTDSTSAHAVTAHCREAGYQTVSLFSASADGSSRHETLLRRALTARPDLVIKPPHDSDWDLADECAAPILLVRGGPWESPVRFAAAVDVSDEETMSVARSILHTAGFLALGARGNLDILYSEREAHDEALRMERAVRLAQLVREFHVGCERIQMFSGEPAKRLAPLVAARRYDVLVLGGVSRRDGLSQLSPGTASRLMDATEGDVVLVKVPATNIPYVTSHREHGLHQREEFA
jgi:nucleotide-binding universal stress UspA family protein